MASGFGVNGGPGRCYSFWLDFTKCLGTLGLASFLRVMFCCITTILALSNVGCIWYNVTIGDADIPADCKPFRDDYVECLHHGKENERRKAVDNELKRQQKLEKEQAADSKGGG